MKRLIAGNWKMNLGPAEASLLVQRLDKAIKIPKVEVVLCPPFVDLYPIRHEIDRKKFKLGAQNLHPADSGAFTGEVSGPMLKGLVDYVIVGHSERRAMGETDKLVSEKVAAAVRNGLTPILCVGEDLQDRHANLTNKVVTDQLEAALQHLTADEVGEIVVAYEPVWAIGVGTPATPDQIQPVITKIRKTIEELYGEAATADLRVLYGASVKPDFVGTIMSLDGVDGLLVGGSSLNYAEFAEIVDRASA